ncbi:MAG TPA: T9SS type A sorting domain-containing protein, partial [Chitinophagaceae bacterium]|nr:T9SS type A sorting domain-containing protein [Chitinophagaceae bacterium]
VAASSFTVNSATIITAVVGTGASGNITITTPGGTVSIAGFTFNTVTGINGPSNNNSIELRIFPNPTIDIAIIKHPSSNKNAQIRVVDIAGRTVKVLMPVRNTTQSQFDLKILPSGLYNLVWSDGIKILSRAFMKK